MVCQLANDSFSKKCFVLQLGHRPTQCSYSVENYVLPVSAVANDLGVSIDSKLRFSHQCSKITTKAHQRASLILRCFESRGPKLLFRAFMVYVRPILEYCSPVWSLVYKTDVRMLESVQKSLLRNYLASSTCRTKTDYFSSILTPSSFGSLKVTLLQCIKLFMVLMTLLFFLNSVLIPVLEVVS